jgi:hypothetical protein
MLMLSDYTRVKQFVKDPDSIVGLYKHKKAKDKSTKIEIGYQDVNTYSLSVHSRTSTVFLGQGTLHKSPLLGGYIEFEMGV